MAKNVTLEYTIYLTDEAQVKALQAVDHGGVPPLGIQANQSPLSAATEFNAPISDPGDRLSSAVTPKQTGAFTPPAITSDWFTSDQNFPLDQRHFQRKGGGLFGISWLFPGKQDYYWVRHFAFAPAVGVTGAGEGSGNGNEGSGEETPLPPPPTPITPRRWIDGAELPFTGTGDGGSDQQLIASRDASRHVDGIGYAFREAGVNCLIGHAPGTINGITNPVDQWERFYVRLRRLPTASADLWRIGSLPSPAQGMVLQIGPAGELLVSSVDAFGGRTLHATAGVLALNVWARLDILTVSAAAGGARPGPWFEVWKDGILKFGPLSVLGVQGTTQTGTSLIGRTSGAANGLEFDVDDWIGADMPTTTVTAPDTGGVITDPSWFAGSRVRLIRPTAIVSAGAWSDPVEGWRRQLQQFPLASPAAPQASGVPLDLITYATDAARAVDGLSGTRGVPAIVFSLYNLASGGANGRIGYALGGGPTVFAAHNNPITFYAWSQALYNANAVTPPPLDVFTMSVEHSNSAQVESHAGFFANAEVLGYWGNEDPRASGSTTAPVQPLVATAMNGIHNAPYPYTPWANSQVMAPAPVGILAGTYLGTGVPADLKLSLPVHWLWIRPLTGVALEGARWWSSMLAVHQRSDDRPRSPLLPDVLIDPDWITPPAGDNPGDGQEFQALVRLLDDPQTNAAGVTYQYVAVSDAAMRFMINGAFAHADGSAQAVNPLWDPNFLAQAGFFWQEDVNGVGTFGAALLYKGVGHLTAAASKLDSAQTADYAEFLAGAVRSKPAAHVIGMSVAVNLWRRDDQSLDPGIPRVLQLVSYVGDGTALRDVNLTPLSGRRPLFCLVTPHNATAAIFRDPSHTGTTSSLINNVTNAATGIIGGGLDAITVGIDLNAVGIVYDVFVLPGDTLACNTGWSCNGIFIPIEPGTGGVPGGVPPEEFPPEPPGGGTGSGPSIETLTTDLTPACAPFTHRTINIALSRIGVTQQVTDLATERTIEATLARLHYTSDVAAVLRDFPWAFATKYAALVRVAGTPTVPAEWDWQYAYRVPSACIFARRLVRPGMARRFDPDPPAFRLGQDVVGNLIYANDAEAVLEFTYRPPCAAGAGDALFADALGWRLAFSLCPGLAKDAKRQAYCWEMYKATLARATQPNANEQQPQRPHDGDPDWITGRN